MAMIAELSTRVIVGGFCAGMLIVGAIANHVQYRKDHPK